MAARGALSSALLRCMQLRHADSALQQSLLSSSQIISLRGFATQQPGIKDAAPDPFLPHLQHKTEKELLELLSKTRGEQEQHGADDEDDAPVLIDTLLQLLCPRVA